MKSFEFFFKILRVICLLYYYISGSDAKSTGLTSITGIVKVDYGYDSYSRHFQGLDIATTSTGNFIISAFERFLLVSNDFGKTLQDASISNALFKDKSFLGVSMSNDGSKIILNTNNPYNWKEPMILFSTNSGCTWSQTNYSLFLTDYWSSVSTKLASSSDGGTVVAVQTKSNLLKSTDYGNTFTTSFDHPSDWICVAISDDATIILAGNDDSELYLSTDSGSFYTKLSSPKVQMYTACTMSSTGSMLYLATELSIFLSSDFGSNWTDITPEPNLSWSEIQTSDDGETVVASTGSTIYLSSDHGLNWDKQFSTLKTVNSMGITADGSGFVATQSSKDDTSSFIYRSDPFTVITPFDLTCLTTAMPTLRPTLRPTAPTFTPTFLSGHATSETCKAGETLIYQDGGSDQKNTGPGYTSSSKNYGCPKSGYYANYESGGCVKCEYPYTTGEFTEGHIYCDAIKFVPEESSDSVLYSVLVMLFLVISITMIRTKDIEIIKISIASALVPAVDFASDVAVLFSAPFWNPRWFSTMDPPQKYTCTGMNDFSIIICFVIFAFVTPCIFFLKLLIENRIESRIHLYFRFPLHREAYLGNTEYIYHIFYAIWFLFLSLPMLPWLSYGCLMYQLNLIPISLHWNYWVQGWTGSGKFYDVEDACRLDIKRLKSCQNSHIFTETIPMFALQNLNTRMVTGFYSSVELISIAVSGLIIFHALVTYLYERLYLGRSHQEMALEISIQIPISIKMPKDRCSFPKVEYLFYRSYNEPPKKNPENSGDGDIDLTELPASRHLFSTGALKNNSSL